MTGLVLDLTTGYGYRPWRGLRWLLRFFALGWLVFWFAGPVTYGGAGIMKPAIPIAYVQSLTRCQPGEFAKEEAPSLSKDRACNAPIAATAPLTSHAIDYALPLEYPPFRAFWYSLDTLIPLVDLGQGMAWSPSPIDGPENDFWGWAVLVYLYFHIIAGWVLASLTVVAMTGIFKKSD